MYALKQIAFIMEGGYRFIQGLHGFYTYVNRFRLLFPLNLFLIMMLLPGGYSSLWIVNLYLKSVLRRALTIDLRNYLFMKQQVSKQEKHVKYFYTFSNAGKKNIAWFMRPLFPLIRKHIELQVEFRNLLQQKLMELNSPVSGNRFVLLKESTLWETRTKTYSYLA